MLALAPERPVEREGDGFALDQGLAGEGLVAAPGGDGEEAVEVHLAVLEEMHQLVGQRLALLVARQPVRQDHDLGHRVVVRGGLLEDQLGEEGREVEVGRDEAPRDHRAPLGVEASGRELPLELAEGRSAAAPRACG